MADPEELLFQKVDAFIGKEGSSSLNLIVSIQEVEDRAYIIKKLLKLVERSDCLVTEKLDCALAHLRTSSLLYVKRVALVDCVQKMSAQEKKRLERYVAESIPQTSLIVFVEDECIREKKGVCLIAIKKDQLHRRQIRRAWVCNEVASKGSSIALDAADFLIERVGMDRMALEQEIEKLVLSVDVGVTVTRKEVDQLTQEVFEQKLFQLVNELVFDEKIHLRKECDTQAEVFPLLALLRRELEICLKITSTLEEQQGSEALQKLREEIKLWPKVFDQYLQKLQKKPSALFALGLYDLFELEYRLKQGALPIKQTLSTFQTGWLKRKKLFAEQKKMPSFPSWAL